MEEMKPRFLSDRLTSGYYEMPNPYVDAPACPVNLLALSRYARKNSKEVTELTKEELEQFLVV